MTDPITHKRGDTFDMYVQLPPVFEDGHFAGWTVASQVRTGKGVLLAELACTWVDPLTTRTLNLRAIDTKDWPLEAVRFDVQFKRASDGYTRSSESVLVYVLADQTQAIAP